MEEFTKSYRFTLITSIPYFPQSNGLAERTVMTAKKLMQQADDPFLALLNYRATPLLWCNLSPAELLMRRRLHTTLPQTTHQLTPSLSMPQAR